MMMVSTVTDRVLAYSEPVAATRQARNDYLEACRNCHPLSYEEVETWAWSRLQRELKRIRRLYG